MVNNTNLNFIIYFLLIFKLFIKLCNLISISSRYIKFYCPICKIYLNTANS
ncbi:unnamed protein product [Choristocarpus tenellus]